MNNRFRDVALALRPHVNDTYSLIEAVDAVLALDSAVRNNPPNITTPDGKATWDWSCNRWDYTPSALVDVVLNNDTILDHMFNSKKIAAIKELRALTGCGLAQAKHAVEDGRVTDYMEAERKDPWSRWSEADLPF